MKLFSQRKPKRFWIAVSFTTRPSTAVGSTWPKSSSVPYNVNAWTVASQIKRRYERKWRPGKSNAMLKASRCIGVSQQLMLGYGCNACIRQLKIERPLEHRGARTGGQGGCINHALAMGSRRRSLRGWDEPASLRTDIKDVLTRFGTQRRLGSRSRRSRTRRWCW
jgi:hypothetical protein